MRIFVISFPFSFVPVLSGLSPFSFQITCTSMRRVLPVGSARLGCGRSCLVGMDMWIMVDFLNYEMDINR